jgi:hypothetical protein
MATQRVPDIDIVVRRFTENGCEVTAIVADPADAQQTLYGTVTRDGVLVGSYYCADRVRQTDWRIVTAQGNHLLPVSEGAAVIVLTTILTEGDPRVIQKRLRAATNHPRPNR